MTSRFVLLHHTGYGEEHWDLMLEHGEVLLTWRLAAEPLDRASLPIPARRIGDHRKAYLDYEGPVSRARGEVVRIDRGPVEIEQLTESLCVFIPQGERLYGRFALRKSSEDAWILEDSESRR